MHQERKPTTVSQLLTQIQDLQKKVHSLSDAREFHDPETANTSGATHVPIQPSTVPGPRTMPSRDSGLPHDTRNIVGTSGNFFERLPAREGRTSTFFGSRTFVSISWMCKKQTSVSHTSTESEIISLDAGLRMDGIPALDLWDLVIEVLRSTNNTAKPGRSVQGNLYGTGDHSINKTKNKTQTEKSKRDVEQLSSVDYVPTATHSSQDES